MLLTNLECGVSIETTPFFTFERQFYLIYSHADRMNYIIFWERASKHSRIKVILNGLFNHLSAIQRGIVKIDTYKYLSSNISY